MKKSTKKTLMALSIVAIFGLSSIAFFFTSFVVPPQQQQNQFTQLTNPIVNGYLDPEYKSRYTQAGYTWIEYYSASPNSNLLSFLEALPQTFTFPNGDWQIVLQKFPYSYSNETDYVIISSARGDESFAGTDINNIFSTLCNELTYTPFECGLRNLTNQSK